MEAKRNAAVALAKIAKLEMYRDAVRDSHGFEVLHQICVPLLCE